MKRIKEILGVGIVAIAIGAFTANSVDGAMIIKAEGMQLLKGGGCNERCADVTCGSSTDCVHIICESNDQCPGYVQKVTREEECEEYEGLNCIKDPDSTNPFAANKIKCKCLLGLCPEYPGKPCCWGHAGYTEPVCRKRCHTTM